MEVRNTRNRKDIEQYKYVIDNDFKGFDEEKSVANPLFPETESIGKAPEEEPVD